MQALQDYLIIRDVKRKEKTDSGLFIPETAMGESLQTAEVVSVGQGLLEADQDCGVSEGDTVYYKANTAMDFKDDLKVVKYTMTVLKE